MSLPKRAQADGDQQIERVVRRLRERLAAPAAAEAEAFARRFFARVPPEDMAGHAVDALCGAALSLWRFGAERGSGLAKIRVSNPKIESQGWQARHSIVEIVTDDMPFLVDSVSAALTQKGLGVHALIHPIVAVRRDGAGRRLGLAEIGQDGAMPESTMHIEFDQQDDENLAQIEAALRDVLADVRAAVEDWRPMLDKLRECIRSLQENPPPLDADEVAEGIALLQWMGDNHFTFLAYREYAYAATAEDAALTVIAGTGLGILRDPNRRIMRIVRANQKTADVAPEVHEFLHQPELLIILKANMRSTVHRPVHLDYIAVKKFGADGQVVGERRFVGLFTSAAYNQMPGDIPHLRRKTRRVFERSGLAPHSHDGKALRNILDTYPRDDLFQISEEDLARIGHGILLLQERPRIRLFVRRDKFQRFVSCHLFAPRERYAPELRKKFEAILAEAFAGRVSAYYTHIGDEPLARVHIIIGTIPGAVPDPDIDAIEAKLVRAARAWTDDLHDALIERAGEVAGLRLWLRFREAFPIAYREQFDAPAALRDIAKIETLPGSNSLALDLYRPAGAPENELRLKLYRAGGPVPLSDCLPVLEHMGLKAMEERPYAIALGAPPMTGAPGGAAAPIQMTGAPGGAAAPIQMTGAPRVLGTQGVQGAPGSNCWIHDFRLIDPVGQAIDLGRAKEKFEIAFLQVWHGAAEDDGFNRLVLRADLDWREVALLRAYAKYLRQVGFGFSQAYIETCLASHAGLARALIALFHARFDPARAPEPSLEREARIGQIEAEFEAGLDKIASLDEDRILRRFLNLVAATLRTNFYQRAEGGGPKPYLALKFDSGKIAELPAPRPHAEIFVCSPKVEGVHLRGGRVARGGIRWSDRREDFRTEVLGLLKAQMVKNAVIVPVGSKGGFVPKHPPLDADREAVLADGIACYKIFISGLLDVTDNLAGAAVRPPADVVRRDGDDPYLVVAADKGTATFSDIANGIAKSHGFWLGDAFASGGSAGYDHKKMAITARGGWELVKRHFREIGHDIQNADFTAIGIGDMSGDVFGNAMLLSRHIKLIGAFDHRHVFVDPDPNPEIGFAERQRLFQLPRSSWADYDAKAVSAGGRIYERKAKALKLTPEIKARLAIDADSLTPAELIRVLLRAPVDLLWVGGIGTYVKASDERHADVGDRANDALRIDGRDLRARVVGEGGNLGFTQRGRIEYALAGGRLNTDAVDNSAGVDCSDHEVNIKILLGAAVADGGMTGEQRDRLLASMTDEVADLVLRDNYLQGQAIGLAAADGVKALDAQARFMRALEKSGRLDRALEYLPDDETLAERRAKGLGLTRPELAVLMAYAKMSLHTDLLEGDLPDDPYFAGDLAHYFPKPLRKTQAPAIERHRLRREIIATSVANSLVNRAGLTFVGEIADETQSGAGDIARAYAIVRDVFDLRGLWAAIEALDNKIAAAAQTRMLLDARGAHRRGSLWFLHNRPAGLDVAAAVAEFQGGIRELARAMTDLLAGAAADSVRARQAALIADGVPEILAGRIAGLGPLVSGLDVTAAGAATGQPVLAVGRVYFALGARLGLDWLRQAALNIDAGGYWDRLAVGALIDDLYRGQRQLTGAVLAAANGASGADAVAAWSAQAGPAVERIDHLLAEFRLAGAIDLSRLAIATRTIQAALLVGA